MPDARPHRLEHIRTGLTGLGMWHCSKEADKAGGAYRNTAIDGIGVGSGFLPKRSKTQPLSATGLFALKNVRLQVLWTTP